MDVVIKEVPELRAVGLRHIGAYYKIGEAFDRLHAVVGARTDAKLVAIFHDDAATTPEAELRSDAAVILPPGAATPEGLREQRLAAGRYACTTHAGSYEGLPGAWGKLVGQWFPLSGERLGQRPSFEIYLNTPMPADVAELRTELYLPLA